MRRRSIFVLEQKDLSSESHCDSEAFSIHAFLANTSVAISKKINLKVAAGIDQWNISQTGTFFTHVHLSFSLSRIQLKKI